MKVTSILAIACLMFSATEAVQINNNRLDASTRASVKRAAASALKIAIAAKKSEHSESIKSDMNEVAKAERLESSD